MSARKRSVQLSETVWDWLGGMVESGEYASLDDAATDLLSTVRRQTRAVPIQQRTEMVQKGPDPVSTTPATAPPEPTPPPAATAQPPNKFIAALKA